MIIVKKKEKVQSSEGQSERITSRRRCKGVSFYLHNGVYAQCAHG